MSEAKADGQCVIASPQLLQGGRRCGMNVVTLIRTCRSKRQKGRKVQEKLRDTAKMQGAAAAAQANSRIL